MKAAKSLYHRLVPGSVRNPIGMFRRRLVDGAVRAFTTPPLPPRELLANIQLTPFVKEYLSVGSRSAASLLRTLDAHGVGHDRAIDLLDFGCGSARVLRHLRASGWRLAGCDVDAAAIEWSRAHLPFARFAINDHEPPLPYDAASFDVITAVSLFTHFSPNQQRSWLSELHRILRPGGLLLLSTMGPSVIANFPAHATAENLDTLARDGSLFIPSAASFNSCAAFHTARGLIERAASHYELLSWSEQGLDGFQDLSVLRARSVVESDHHLLHAPFVGSL